MGESAAETGVNTAIHDQAETALALMAQGGVPPTPENFELFFKYASHENAGLSRVPGDTGKDGVDPLTDIADQKAFDSGLDQAIADSHSGDEPVSLILCVVDKFEDINKARGRQAGDNVLRLVANCLRENVKGFDTAA